VPGMPVTEQPVRSDFDDRSSRAASPRLSSNCICCGIPGSVIGVMSVCHVHRTAPVPLFMGQPPHTRAIDHGQHTTDPSVSGGPMVRIRLPPAVSQAMRPLSGTCGSCRPHTHMEWPFPLDFLEIFTCWSDNDLHFVRERCPPKRLRGDFRMLGFAFKSAKASALR